MLNHGRRHLVSVSYYRPKRYCPVVVVLQGISNVFPRKVEPSFATRTGQYLLGR